MRKLQLRGGKKFSQGIKPISEFYKFIILTVEPSTGFVTNSVTLGESDLKF